ncbi:MAG: acyl-CoA dehydrogenase family protein [Polycyclovorans sp.]|jgi:alkylation response protein AidB-like acyl-CoA dehydrogenase|nr:acyl-CoA dehydrogenase family protein [Polycyclovorans sp.]
MSRQFNHLRDALETQCAELEDQPANTALHTLIAAGLDQLPLPGQGETHLRWQCLALVASRNLSLAKLYEGHTDAHAIIAELGGVDIHEGSRWAIWAAEPPHAKVSLTRHATDVRLHGRKAWCSGATTVTHALVTCWATDRDPAQGPMLAAVAIDQPGVSVSSQGWHAVGMADAASVEVAFDNAVANPIGDVGDYLARAGFWHGGAGVAACWYGGAVGLANTLRQRLTTRTEPHAAAHLGAVDVALSECAALLRHTAHRMDQDPERCFQLQAMRARASAERTATFVIDHVGRALGATPYCVDPVFARRVADLPVFVRQSHAERDLEVLGTLVASSEEASWWL